VDAGDLGHLDYEVDYGEGYFYDVYVEVYEHSFYLAHTQSNEVD
jgi:hypothetical protein